MRGRNIMKAFFRNYIAGCRKEIAAVLLCSLFCSLLTVGCSGIMNRIVEETIGSAQDDIIFGEAFDYYALAQSGQIAAIDDLVTETSPFDGKSPLLSPHPLLD